mgnify:FL=1
MTFMIFEQVSPAPSEQVKFRIAETYLTSEGMRTRLTPFAYSTADEARTKVALLEATR